MILLLTVLLYVVKPSNHQIYSYIYLQFGANSGYMYEASAHWISSYFLKDPMRLPSSAEEALTAGAYYAAWLRKRFPDVSTYVNESYCSALCLWE